MSVYLCGNCEKVKGVKGTASIFTDQGNDKFNSGKYRAAMGFYNEAAGALQDWNKGCSSCIKKLNDAAAECGKKL